MSYLVLARKYRPQSFQDLVGQDHVARTLGNGILQGRVAHAFLFTGARGVGKTTSARLLAKCLNCLGADGRATGPVVEPCGVCAACTEITQGVDMDVQEIDGASYNGIDEVRRLQETMGYRPARDRFKVYVVDEVHMLSTSAWNAFLKTLEEPPPHVKFIFATTEIQKVPVTILSRCQRYDFRLVSVAQIAERLAHILTQEGLESEPAALRLVARQAAGSMRDALSLLDQVLAYATGPLTERDVSTVLGVADHASVSRAAQAVLAADAAAALRALTEALGGGVDLGQYARDLLEYFRDAMTAKVSDEAALFELPPDELQALRAYVAPLQDADLARVFQGFSTDFERIVRSHAPRYSLEMSLLKLASRAPLLPVDELLTRLRDLERRILAKAGPPGPPEPASPTAFFPVPAGETSREAPEPAAAARAPSPTPVHPRAATPAPLSPFAAPPELDAERPATPRPSAPPARQPLTRAVQPEPSPFTPPPMLDDDTLAPLPQAAPRRESRPPQAMRPPEPATFSMPPEERWGEPGEGTLRAQPGIVSAPPPPREPVFVEFGKVLSEDDERVARATVDALRAEAPVLASAIENAWIAEVTPNGLTFAFPQGSFLGSGIDELAKVQLQTAVRQVLGPDATVAVVSHLSPNDTATSIAERDARLRYAAELEARRQAEQHPLVLKAAELLRARVRHVRLTEKE